MTIGVEIVADDVAGAVLAEQEGAHRIELCAALSEGGVTPSLGLAATVLSAVRRIGVRIMVRPRGGDFEVEASELDVMLADIAAFRALRATPGVEVGFVFGALMPDRTIDRETVNRLKAACGDAPTTFHKAFDLVPDQAAALETLESTGIDRILTSGGAPTAEAGTEALAALVRRSGGRIGILAGGGIRARNARAIVDRTGVREVHLRAMRERPGRPPATSREEIAALMRALAP